MKLVTSYLILNKISLDKYIILSFKFLIITNQIEMRKLLMKIEDKWKDAYLYYVTFRVEQCNLFRVIDKTLVLYEELKIDEIAKIIKRNFNDVHEVLSVDVYQEVLVIKECG